MTKTPCGLRRPASLRQAAPAPGPAPTASCARAVLASGAALAASVLVVTPGHAQEAPATARDAEIALDALRIEDRTLDANPYAERGAPYKARISGDARRNEPLADTPQTLTVITQAQIQESGATDLRDIVQAQPGVTVGTGENGNAFGDRYIIRGQEARSDVFIDGLRDVGMTLRETFAVEQVEIAKGPSATFAGRGTAGGAINSITKQASTDYNHNRIQAGLGTDSYRRVTLDSNMPLGEIAAARVNLLHAYEEVPDRGPADRERNGAALSVLIKPSPRFNVLADYYYLKAEDAPDMGAFTPQGGRPVKTPVYLQDEDFLRSEVNSFTLRATYDVSPAFRISNAARYGKTENGYLMTGARLSTRGAFDLAPGVPTFTASGNPQGWQEVEYFVDNLNLFWDVATGDVGHKIVAGVEYADLSVTNGLYTVANTAPFNCITGATSRTNNAYCFTDPSGATVANAGRLLGRSLARAGFDSDYGIKTWSVYLSDTVRLSERFELFAGLRWDSFDYENLIVSQGARTRYAYSDELWSGHAGLVYKPTEDLNFYLSWSRANEINGGESDTGSTCGYGGICSGALIALSRPEVATNLEAGAKLELMEEKLLLTAALFETTKTDVMEGADYTTFGSLNTGENRVRGLEVSAVGNLTSRLSGQLALAVMDSKITRSSNPANLGRRLSNFANVTAYAQLRYQLTPRLALGGSVTHSSPMYAGQPDAAAAFSALTGAYTIKTPGYTTLDLFATLDISAKTSLRLNLGNVTNEDYYIAAYRSGTFTYIGDKRQAQLTLSHAF